MAPLIVSQTTGDEPPAIGGLFNGLSFFLVQRVPSRQTFISRIQANGGRVVKLEGSADHVVADHLRLDAPPGSISYTYIEKAIKEGELPDPAAHLAGPAEGTVREVGSSVPGKITRRAFTAEEDRVLWEWVERSKAEGAAVKGHAIYKDLESIDKRHTYQSWRDRYIKKLMDNPPAGVKVQVSANPPPTPPTAPDEENQQYTIITAESAIRFGRDEYDILLENAKDVEDIDSNQIDDAWEAWAEARSEHTAAEWRQFYHEIVRPVFLASAESADAGPDTEAQPKTKSASTSATSQPTTTPIPSRVANDVDLIQSDDASSSARPTGAQKRKKVETTPKAKFTPGNKRPRLHTPDHGPASDMRKKMQSSRAGRTQNPPAEVVEIFRDDGDRRPDTAVDVLPKAAQVTRESPQKQQPSDQIETSDAQLSQETRFPTSDMNYAADQQVRRESLEGVEVHSGLQTHRQLSDLATSEANNDADQQIRRESFDDGNGLEGDELDRQAMHFPTSEANGAADQQLRRESIDLVDRQSDRFFESANAQDAHGNAAPHSAPLDSDPGEVDMKDEGNLLGQDVPADQEYDGEDKGSLPEQEHLNILHGSAALTVANLASQQAMHNPPVVRGIDLPEDDTQEDQSDFRDYLKKLTGQEDNDQLEQFRVATTEDARQKGNVEPARPVQSDEPPSLHDDGDIDSEALSLPEDMMDTAQHEHNESDPLPDDVYSPGSLRAQTLPRHSDDEGSNSLPESPSLSQRQISPEQAVSQLMGEYEEAAEDELTSSQLLQLPPDLHERHEALDERHSSPWKEAAEDELTSSQLLQPHPDLQQERDHALDAEMDNFDVPKSLPDDDDDLDLTVPEPEGGWETLSLPSEDDGSLADLARPRHPTEANRSESYTSPQRVNARRQAPIEISSASSSLSSSASEIYEEKPSPLRADHDAKVLYTQDILNAETQRPDLELSLPSDVEEDFEELREDPLRAVPPASPFKNTHDPATRPSMQQHDADSTRPHQLLRNEPVETTKLDDDDVDEYVATLILRKGYTENSIIAALKATTMQQELAKLVLIEQRAGKGMPQDVAGIWTEEDDSAVESGDARRLKLCVQKHGWDQVTKRMDFLQDWRKT